MARETQPVAGDAPALGDPWMQPGLKSLGSHGRDPCVPFLAYGSSSYLVTHTLAEHPDNHRSPAP